MTASGLYSGIVESGWIDALGHMNFLEYQRIADRTSDRFWTAIGGEPASPDIALSYVMLKIHVHYLHELRLGNLFTVDTRLVSHDHRRFHLHHTILGPHAVACRVQALYLAFDARTRRAACWPSAIIDGLARRQESFRDEALGDVLEWIPRAGS